MVLRFTLHGWFDVLRYTFYEDSFMFGGMLFMLVVLCLGLEYIMKFEGGGATAEAIPPLEKICNRSFKALKPCIMPKCFT